MSPVTTGFPDASTWSIGKGSKGTRARWWGLPRDVKPKWGKWFYGYKWVMVAKMV